MKPCCACADSSKSRRPRAQEFLDSGRFLWNAGIFAWRTDTILAALQRQLPQAIRALEKLPAGVELEAAFAGLPGISIDVAVLERESDVRTIPIDYFWSDVGAWTALEDVIDPDASGNRVTGGTALANLGGANNIVYGEDGQLVALIGVENLVVVRAGNAVLVATRERVDEVRALVEGMTRENSPFV